MIPREWLMAMRVCGVWVGERCRGVIAFDATSDNDAYVIENN